MGGEVSSVFKRLIIFQTLRPSFSYVRYDLRRFSVSIFLILFVSRFRALLNCSLRIPMAGLLGELFFTRSYFLRAATFCFRRSLIIFVFWSNLMSFLFRGTSTFLDVI